MSNYLFWLADSDPSYVVLCLEHAGGEPSAHATDDPCDECAREDSPYAGEAASDRAYDRAYPGMPA